jgi:hypothetical protein
VRVEERNPALTSNDLPEREHIMNTQENRTEPSNPIHFARATAAFLVLLVMGYAFSTTQVESAIDSSAPAVTAKQDLAPTPYFPAQYVNQGTAVEEHIQAY